MKHFLIIAVQLFCFVASAQIQGSSGKGLITIEAGYTNFQASAFNNYFSAQSYNGRFERLTNYGIGITLPGSTHRGHTYDCQFGFHLFQQNTVGASPDSLSYTARGWELMTSIFGYDLLHNRSAVDLVVAPGMFWGRLKMEVKENTVGTEKNYWNGFVAPMARIDLRFNIRSISVGGRLSYRYDITKDKWKRNYPESGSLPGYRFREMQYLFYIGWILKSE